MEVTPMANATQSKVSKFFPGRVREVVLFLEDDFDTLKEFKAAIRSQIETLYDQNVELQFQHIGYMVDGNGYVTYDPDKGHWVIDSEQLDVFCTKHKCKLITRGHKGNNHIWRIVPAVKVVLDDTAPF
jgi:hypothetical protein